MIYPYTFTIRLTSLMLGAYLYLTLNPHLPSRFIPIFTRLGLRMLTTVITMHDGIYPPFNPNTLRLRHPSEPAAHKFEQQFTRTLVRGQMSEPVW